MKIHFLGVGGVGMAALALLMKGEGHEVSGCDIHRSPRLAWLEKNGIATFIGHNSDHCEDADVVIATPAVSRDNPEFVQAQLSGKLRWRGDVLAEIVSRRDSIAVCGSHGKTTTSTFIAKLLRELGEDPAWAIGGETGAFPVAGLGKGPLVVEADESDGTLANYHARELVVTNCEYDHPDHFKTEADYFACYDKARANAAHVIESPQLALDGWNIDIAGEHNRRNARTAIEVALRRGHGLARIMGALPRAIAELPDRRFQRLAVQVYTDYAHHPTEMKCAIAMAKSVCKGRLRVLFQPHRYSRTKALMAAFPEAFRLADEVVLCPTYAAFEPPQEGGSSADLYAACRSHYWCASQLSPRFYLARTCLEAWRHARLEMREGDVVLILGAGDIIELAPVAVRETPCAPGEPRETRLSFFGTVGRTYGGGNRVIVGEGSNTWITDLSTDEEYMRASGPAAKPGITLGIPWMAGIPGSIGGWIKMNAGAFGHSISELVARVKVDGRWLEKEECGFGYRTSSINGEIQNVEFVNIEEQSADGKEKSQDYLSRRRKFPPRCCGSVFKNPPGDFAGRLLEEVGAKGMEVGGAYVWQEHANVIATRFGATASDVLALARILRDRVCLRLGVELEYEVCGLGN